MTQPPAEPNIYHITHVDNLPSIMRDGCLLSDAMIIARGGPAAPIGMSTIKRRRVYQLEVTCHPGTKVGEYVPFYFCPRSIMLYVIHCANHPELAYRGGQDPVVHLVCDLRAVVAWAEGTGTAWAFSLANAGAYYAEFRSRLVDLNQLDWRAIVSTDFRSASVKEGKQAEFLVFGRCPWGLVTKIGVRSAGVRAQVLASMRGMAHQPPVAIEPTWYY